MPLTTNNQATLLKVLNSESELAAFPVEGEVAVLFTAPLDEVNIKETVFLVRSKATQGVINISETDVRVLGDLATDQYDVVPYNYVFETSSVELGSRPIMKISPLEPLLPNNEYYLISSKNLAPKFYDSAKTVSLGPSRISLKISPTAKISNIPTSPQTLYEITITAATSGLSATTHNISYTLTKNGTPVVTNQQINIKADKLNINNGVDVEFFPNAPFAVGEKFEVALVRFTRAGSTKVQKIVTYLESDLIPLPPDEESTRLSQEQLLDFYEKNGFARRIGNGQSVSTVTVDPTQVLSQASFEFQYPARILITLTEEIDESTLTADAFKIDIGPAFDNYLLPNMSLYSEQDKFIIKYKLIEDDFGASNTIELMVNKDTNNTVPPNEKFIIQAA